MAAAVLTAGPAGRALPTDTPGFVSSYDWVMDDPLFGGISAIEVAPDGLGFVAISDRGAAVAGDLVRDAAGRIAGVSASPPRALKGVDADSLPVDDGDTEGLAIGTDGAAFIAFEVTARVQRHDDLSGRATMLPIPPEFAGMELNGSLEALAIDAAGTLYAVPEVTDRPDGVHPIYRFRDGVWDVPFGLQGRGGFLPVGADIGPDGRFYLLEREFYGLGGFASRVRRFDLAAAGLAREEVLFETPPGRFGNFEGIAVWRDAAGALRLTLVTDDNFLPVLGTQIVEFRVPD